MFSSVQSVTKEEIRGEYVENVTESEIYREAEFKNEEKNEEWVVMKSAPNPCKLIISAKWFVFLSLCCAATFWSITILF